MWPEPLLIVGSKCSSLLWFYYINESHCKMYMYLQEKYSLICLHLQLEANMTKNLSIDEATFFKDSPMILLLTHKSGK